ncbi:MAG: addiction module protein, partial [Bifidobacteriaceae bacterium]|nr:addiction module protein [Bifidobacteriaceae bacterium]
AVATILAVDDLDQRALVADRLEQSLHADDGARQSAVRAAWRDEISSRVDQVLSGEVALVDADETYRLLSVELADMDR